jgi:hypothetical protein
MERSSEAIKSFGLHRRLSANGLKRCDIGAKRRSRTQASGSGVETRTGAPACDRRQSVNTISAVNEPGEFWYETCAVMEGERPPARSSRRPCRRGPRPHKRCRGAHSRPRPGVLLSRRGSDAICDWEPAGSASWSLPATSHEADPITPARFPACSAETGRSSPRSRSGAGRPAPAACG